jgi:hypothetical protein
VIKSYSNFDNFLQDKYTFISAGIIIPVGVVMFIIGTVGCYATLRESKVVSISLRHLGDGERRDWWCSQPGLS